LPRLTILSCSCSLNGQIGAVSPESQPSPESATRLTWRGVVGGLVQFAISLALIWWALSQVSLGAARSRMETASVPMLLATFVILLFQVYLASRRWQRVNSALGFDGSLGWHWRVFMASLFLGQLLPSTIGGDAYRIWGVARHRRHGFRAGFLSVVCDRALGLGCLLILIAAGFPLLALSIGTGEAFWAVTLVALGGSAAMAFVIVYGKVPFALSFLKIAEALMAPAGALKKLLSNRPEAMSQLKLGCTIQLLSIFAFWLLAQALSVPFTMLEALAIVPPVVLLSILPISIAGWGVREGAMLAAFTLLSHPAEDAVVLSVSFGLESLFVGLAGGLIWGFFRGQRWKNLR
jgi:uncharacterized protein (TIRG00374 family)